MRVISTPSRLRWATLLIFAAVPAAGLQILLTVRTPWERLPLHLLEGAAVAAVVVLTILSWSMARGKRWALRTLGWIAAAWCLANAWVAIRSQNPSLGFFTAFLVLFWLLAYYWLRHEMGRSFFDPRLRWYVGRPKPISGLKCELIQGAERSELIVGRFDRDGAFVFSPVKKPLPELRGRDADLTFYFRDRQVKCTGRAVRALDEGDGMGFQFHGLSPDGRKDLGDFLEALRGEGHVD